MGRIFRKATKHNQAGPNKQLVSGAPRRGAGEPLCGLPSLTEQAGFPKIIAKGLEARTPWSGRRSVCVSLPGSVSGPDSRAACRETDSRVYGRSPRFIQDSGHTLRPIGRSGSPDSRLARPAPAISLRPHLRSGGSALRSRSGDVFGRRQGDSGGSHWNAGQPLVVGSAERTPVGRGASQGPLRSGGGFSRFSGDQPAGLVQPGPLADRPQEDRALLSAFCFNLDPVLEDQNLHVADRFHSLLEPMGVAPGRRDIRLEVPSENRIKAEQFLRGKRDGWMSVPDRDEPGSQRGRKNVAGAELCGLADKLASRLDLGFLFFCGPGEEDLLQQVESSLGTDRYALAGRLGLKDLAAVISRCHLLVSNDSGPMHFGPALGVPTLGLFSLSAPLHYRPLGDRSRVVRKVPIRDLRVEEVFEQVAEMMDLGEWRVDSD